VRAASAPDLRSASRPDLLGLLGGVCGKLLWDSRIPPLFFWPLALVDLVLLWDAVRRYREGRRSLRREVQVEARLRELRLVLGIDP